MDTPTTSWPCSLSSAAAREESTPPDMATTTRMGRVYGLTSLGGGLPERLPGGADVTFLRAEVADGEAEDRASLQPGVGEVGRSRRVHSLHDLHVAAVLLLRRRTGEAGPEADDGQRRGGSQLET